MRALGDPDAFLVGDLGVRRALERLGHPGDERAVAALAERWRPWRAYAALHLWRSLDPHPTPPGTAPRPTPSRRRPRETSR
jgi:AraC family transcriptional regulator of adaptative response / DNA-3-methyladenine glycosylase II